MGDPHPDRFPGPVAAKHSQIITPALLYLTGKFVCADVLSSLYTPESSEPK